MTGKVKIGILGGGGILHAHGPALNACRDLCTVTAVAEANPALADAIRGFFGPDVRILPDYRQVLALPDVEAVDILLPHHLHRQATEESARRKKHVLVEKVMARNIYECDRMIAACERHGVSLTVCHDRRYQRDWQGLKGVIEAGVLGDIFFWKLDHNQDVVFPEGSWGHSRDGMGGGCIMSCLTHQIDALRWFGGEVESVTCMANVRPERMEGEFNGVIAARMRSGALAELSINWWTRANQGKNRLWYEMVHVCGTRGEAYRMDGRGVFVRLHDPTDEAAVARYGASALEDFARVETSAQSGHEGCIREWLKRLRHEPAAVVTSGRECRGTVEVAEAAYRSAATGKVTHLPIRPRKWKSTGATPGL